MYWNGFYWRHTYRDEPRQGFEVIDVVKTELTTTEPVGLPEVKTHLHITDSENDIELTAMITRARLVIENYTSLSLIYKRIVLTGDIYGEWSLPYGPLIGLEGVKNQESTVGSGIPRFVSSESGWGIQGGKFLNRGGHRQQLTYTAGYTTVPKDLKAAILAQIYWMYEHKGNELESLKMSTDAMGLADPYRRLEWI